MMFSAFFRDADQAGKASRRGGHGLACLTLCCALGGEALLATSAHGQTAGTHHYRIDGGSLDDALSQYADEADISLAIDNALTDGKTTRGLDGDYSAMGGLRVLLAETGLEAVARPDGGYALRSQEAATAGARARSGKENALSTITVTSASASGYAVDVAEAPASISVITKEELEGKSYRDLTEALQDVPGVYVDDGPSGKGGTEEISIRGMDSKYTLILVDGKPQGSSQAYYNELWLGRGIRLAAADVGDRAHRGGAWADVVSLWFGCSGRCDQRDHQEGAQRVGRLADR